MKNHNRYECVIILSENMSEEEINKIDNDLKNIFQNCGAYNITLDKKEKKKFAYPIKKLEYGHYLFYKFESPPETIDKIKESIKHNENILRSYFINYGRD